MGVTAVLCWGRDTKPPHPAAWVSPAPCPAQAAGGGSRDMPALLGVAKLGASPRSGVTKVGASSGAWGHTGGTQGHRRRHGAG